MSFADIEKFVSMTPDDGDGKTVITLKETPFSGGFLYITMPIERAKEMAKGILEHEA